jgi:uncharacterized membrane protein YphA (DoxX/SURF4 family)
MNALLWALQVFLAGIFLLDGYLKFFKPATQKVQGLNDMGLVLFIGFSEILGAAGLILPALTRILPWITPLAALGIAVIMVLASRFHLKRHEGGAAGYTFFLLALSVAVALGRFTFSPLG